MDEKVTFKASFPLNVMTRNNRIYTSEAMNDSIKDEYVQTMLSQGGIPGTFGDDYAPLTGLPPDLLDHDPSKTAFLIKELEVVEGEESHLTAKLETVSATPYGKELIEELHKGIAFSIAPRVLGKLDEQGRLEPGFKIISFDLVPTDVLKGPDLNRLGSLYPEDPNAQKYTIGIDTASGTDKTAVTHYNGSQEVIE